mgnify:FL=1
MTQYQIAQINDLPVLLELVREFHEIERLDFDKTLDRQVLYDFVTHPSWGQVWLIHQEDEVIGYIVLTLSYSLEYRGRDAFIDEFYIRANYRGQGIGTQTLEFIEQACRSLGVKALHLEVDFKNPEAQRLYHRTGYQRHERFLMTKLLENQSD